jgi:hypothetical protein
MLAIALVGSLTNSHASDKSKKIAVYVSSSELDEFDKELIETRILVHFVNSKKYEPTDRSHPYLMELARELEAQRDGTVDIKQISSLGVRGGTDFVCIVRFVKNYISTRLIKTDSATIKGISEPIFLNRSDIGSGKYPYEIFKQITANETVAKSEEPKIVYIEKQQHENFTKPERFGTFLLNHALGLGSYIIQDNGEGAAFILGFQAAGALLFGLGSIVRMPDRSDYDEYGRRNYGYESYEDDRSFQSGLKYSLVVSGLICFGIAEIANVYHSFSYKSSTAGLDFRRNFNLAILSTRNGNVMAYGLMYNKSF